MPQMRKIREEAGIAMVTVVVLSAVLMMLGGGMYFLASRENRMTSADYMGGQAFYYAEGGIENAIDILNYAATDTQLMQRRPDESAEGYGCLMESPNCDKQAGIVMKIGNEEYLVWVETVTKHGDPCSGCGLDITRPDIPAYLLISAKGWSGDGYRLLRQRVKVQASKYPVTLFINGDAVFNGNPAVIGQSLYVKGDFWGREKLTVSGDDLISGDGAAGVFATGAIYAKTGNSNSQIYTESGSPSGYFASPQYDNDRDSRGPAGNTFSPADLVSSFDTGGLTTSQLLSLKGMAQTDGFYREPAPGKLTIKQNMLPSRAGNIVVYVEYFDGNPEDNLVELGFKWSPAGYSGGKAFIVVRNGSIKMTGTQIGNLHGFIYCPDGPLTVHGGGQGSFTGPVWAKGITEEQGGSGNFVFNMTSDFLADPPFLAWTVVRLAAWTEVDWEE
ncbi:MAG: pilus assembly PilX N-terminal domain-containing protein [Thermoleophilia bacterium]|nr:pilus assembly PilX N-terminal domain-containing protein [Thermoleophilia bacterium]